MADLLLKKETTLERFRLRQSGSVFFYLSLLLFFVTLASYGGLLILNRAQRIAAEELMGEVRQKEGEIRPELINQIFLLDARLKNMRTLLAAHLFPSNIFRRLEALTHPQVRFISFNFSADGRKLDMSGEALSFRVLADQLATLEREATMERVEFGGLSLGSNNLLGFKLAIIFKPVLLELRP